MELCIVDYAKYNSLYLNREIINLLCSIENDLWDPQQYILKLQQDQLQSYANMLINNDVAKTSMHPILERHGGFFKNIINNIDIISDRFWWSVIQAYYLRITKLLRYIKDVYQWVYLTQWKY